MSICNQLLVPSKIDIPLILTSLGYSDSYINHHQDKYNYVLHKILENRIINKIKEDEDNDFTPLHLDTLRSMLGQPYCDNILKELLALNIIETDNQYIIGEKSKGYRISSEYASKAVLRFIFKETFERKLKLAQVAYKARISRANRLTWKNLNQLGIRQEEALAYLAAKYSTDSVEDITKYNLAACAVHMIATQHFFLEQPDTQSRIYTNLSNLPSDLRQFLYHKKTTQHLVNLDIRNSQPYLFSLLLMDRYKEQQSVPDDVTLYIKLTAEGKFYEHVMNLLNVPLAERQAFKTEFFATIFFCKSYHSKRTVQGKAFKQHFPNVYELINEYKKEAHRNLSIQMQRREASIILKTIGGELKKQKVWSATIHDSVVVLQEHAEQVKELILASFFKAVGVPPTVKAEVW